MIRAARIATVVVALAGTSMVVVACNEVTGSASYSDVSRCTGSACAKRCDLVGGEWQSATSECRCACYQGVQDLAGKCPPGRDTAPLCGKTCCGISSVCVTTSAGEPICGAVCEPPAVPCGQVCCFDGQKCINPDFGVCANDYGALGHSCLGGLVCPSKKADGTLEQADCCQSIAMVGGAFAMGRSSDGANACPTTPSTTCDPSETPVHTVTLTPFSIDRFEVTVERFRRFARQWDYRPLPLGAGADAHLAYSGWQAGWDAYLPLTFPEMDAQLSCDPATQTWTPSLGLNEKRPINCVTWYVAFAFCAWDGERLPTEAEWEFAAGNGTRADLYPWGSPPPDPTLAVYDCSLDPSKCASRPLLPAPVGSLPNGSNAQGVRDLAGNVSEWVLDTYSPYPTMPTDDYLVTTVAGGNFRRSLRGGSFLTGSRLLRSAARFGNLPLVQYNDVGFRCVRRS